MTTQEQENFLAIPTEAVPLDKMVQMITEEMDDLEASALGLRMSSVNLALLRSRQAKGLTQKKLGELVGINIGTLSHFENLWAYPQPKIAQKIAVALGKEVKEVFPEYLKLFLRRKKHPVNSYLEVPMSQVEGMLVERAMARMSLEDDNSTEDLAMKTLLKEDVEDVLCSLGPRARQVIKLEYGIAPYDKPHTRKEIAQLLDRHELIIRQIETRAIRKLRHPSRSRKLKGYLK